MSFPKYVQCIYNLNSSFLQEPEGKDGNFWSLGGCLNLSKTNDEVDDKDDKVLVMTIQIHAEYDKGDGDDDSRG